MAAATPWLLVARAGALASEAARPELPVVEGERLLIIAPHPDDEALGAAGLAQRVIARGGTVRTLVVTAGDGFLEAVQEHSGRLQPRPSDYVRYGRRRIAEANAATRALSPRGIRLDVLGFPDGGLLPLLSQHRYLHAERSATTGRSRPPYPDVLDRQLAYAGSDLRSALARVMREFKPTLLAFTDPLDEHSDHRAVGTFALLAVSDFMRGQPASAPWPRMLAYLVHWKQWPPDSGQSSVPTHLVDLPLELPGDLPLRDQERGCLTLSDHEMQQKQATLRQYETQLDVLGPFLSAFVRRTECFSVNTPQSARAVDVEIEQRLGKKSVRGVAAPRGRAAGQHAPSSASD